VRCFGHIHLSDGIPAFKVDRPRPAERGPVPLRGLPRAPLTRMPFRTPSEDLLERGVAELQRAEARLPHVSRGYFVMRWKSHQLPPAGHEREALVQQMLEAGLIEEIEVTDPEGRQVIALRSRERNGNIALPG
jgi:hypothetical protein